MSTAGKNIKGGATYDGIEKQWSLPPGVDLRQVLDSHPDWFAEQDVIRRRVQLRIIASLDEDPLLR